MSSHLQGLFGRVFAMLPATVVILCALGTVAAAQDQPAPKWELYGGYSFWYPGGDIHGIRPAGLATLSSRLESNPRGAGASLTYNFNRTFGLTVDTSTHWGSGESTLFGKLDDAGLTNLSIGPKFTFRHKHFSPFFEALVGDHRLMPEAFHHVNKIGFMGGGGLDLNLSQHFALRLLRADAVFSNYRYGPAATTEKTSLAGLRLQAGINFMWGYREAATPPSAACSVDPAEVYAGETVTLHANGSNFNPKHTVKYEWIGTGVKATGTDASTQVDTTGLQPGPYQVTANLNDGSKQGGFATCSAKFIVKQARPPEVSCASDPSRVRAGVTSGIHATASSPDNRKLTYSYSASAGSISGTDASATLNTTGAQPGPITVTCTVKDDRNPPLTASAMTNVTVEAPPPPPQPPAEVKELESRLALHSIYFQTARPTEKNPGGGLVESQEGVLVALAGDFKRYLTYKPDAHLTLGGHADHRGTPEYNKALTERRVERAKSVLVEHGVPAGNIQVQAFGEEQELTDEQVKQQMQENPDLTPEDRQKMLRNLSVIVLANNRRVDVSLSTTGQTSTRRYPFNAQDALALIDTKGVSKQPVVKKRPKKK